MTSLPPSSGNTFAHIAGFRPGGAFENFSELGRRRRHHQELKEKSVELRFGQRIGAFELDRILRRQNHEWRLENMRFAEHGHLLFFHRFEHRGLGFRRGAIDLVGQHDVSEDRTFLELKLAPTVGFGEHFRADDVRRHQVRRKLNALKSHAEGFD